MGFKLDGRPAIPASSLRGLVSCLAEAASNSKNSADIWVTMLVRDRALVSVRGDTRLTAGDEVLISAEERWHPQLESLFRAI